MHVEHDGALLGQEVEEDRGVVGHQDVDGGQHIGVVLEDGTDAPQGEVGEVWIRTPGNFRGYLGQPEETAARFQGEWFLTGDLAVASDDGAIATLGRADDMMNAGGFRVAPSEVEDVLAPVPGTGDVAVTELPVPGGASIIAAFWTGQADGAALQAAAETGLARYKQPREFIHVEALPRTPTGKINRRALREAHRKDA